MSERIVIGFGWKQSAKKYHFTQGPDYAFRQTNMSYVDALEILREWLLNGPCIPEELVDDWDRWLLVNAALELVSDAMYDQACK